MIAFHGKVSVKNNYLRRVKAHAKADEIIKGEYWENGKGCAVGCTIHSGNHSQYESELGIPQWLARVEDRLFEGMSNEKAKKWPFRFLKAIKPGADLEAAKAPFLICVLESALTSFDHAKYPQVKKVVEDSLTLWKRLDIGSAGWKKDAAAAYAVAAYAADAAADAYAAADADAYAAAAADADADAYAYAYAAAAAAAAAYAAAAAAYAAYAAYTAYAADAACAYAVADADAAAAAAADAAYAAAYAAAAAARRAKFDYFADQLLTILAGCK